MPNTKRAVEPDASEGSSPTKKSKAATTNQIPAQSSSSVPPHLTTFAFEAPNNDKVAQTASISSTAPSKFVPQFRPANRMAPESTDEVGESSGVNDQVAAQGPSQPSTFKDTLALAQEQSAVWQYVKNLLDGTKFNCKSELEQQAYLQILSLPKRNDLDDKIMWEADKHQRRYHVIMGAILQVVGVEGHCSACPVKANSEHKQQTCIGLPPTATGPEYEDLQSYVASRCCNCIRSTYAPHTCSFKAGHPSDDQQISSAAAAVVKNNCSASAEISQPQTRASVILAAANEALRTHFKTSPSASPKTGKENASLEAASKILAEICSIGFDASNQLPQNELADFLNWMTSMFSFSPSSPDLEKQAIALRARILELPPNIQTIVRQRVVDMLPGAMGRPA
ncbi:hypothetical protein J7T55_004535 [Diaporthe amygdali]|uniref:uncharacterized protein n=1 Tax=Phomopsis amygdali TaxID=1214568 RepID=UPI0022FDC55C|nr:uncharacterized protein J7T55_004535 [Diaporthe amygdali]KAJ0114794.1 hypothetical protein J7T55_004535 [Diaporthe amygdali]